MDLLTLRVLGEITDHFLVVQEERPVRCVCLPTYDQDTNF